MDGQTDCVNGRDRSDCPRIPLLNMIWCAGRRLKFVSGKF